MTAAAALARPLPLIIQGGMGIGVSNWRLARAVSRRGQLGVVSGTCMDSLLVRRLQDGDAGGHVRRAMAQFPLSDVSEDALRTYFLPGGRAEGEPYRLVPMWTRGESRAKERLTLLASFVEVHLAREGHGGPVGINLLTKIQLGNLATLYGAMLAGVDYVLMGAGIPREIPGALDAFAAGEAATNRFDVEGLERGEAPTMRFDPRDHFDTPPALARPAFFPIIASHSLATMMARKANGRVDGFVIEGPTAGGHNAPPRGRGETNARGEPVYGDRDVADLNALRELGFPFWLAGGVGSPAALGRALEEGAAGIQVGTLFAHAEESGLDPALRRRVLHELKRGKIDVRTDGRASPTGFPFKVVELAGTNAEAEQYARRTRTCDLGYLRTPYRRHDGRVGFRCAAEPEEAFRAKNGSADETVGRKCLCNGLLANIGLAQLRDDGPERPLLTAGDDLLRLATFLGEREGYTVDDALDYLLSALPAGGSAGSGNGAAPTS